MSKKASVFTELYWLVQDREIQENSFFLFLEFFWPTFHEIDGYIFLKENFLQEQYIQLKSQKKISNFGLI